MAAESPTHLELEIGHVLFIDIVGYSKLLITEQSELLRKLTAIVIETEQVRLADAQGKLIRLPTGDGMALVFRSSPAAPAQCALELSKQLKSHPELRVRMGIHSGPVNEVTDVNGRTNITGAGINIAQRVMDCGDAGHILLSRHVAEDLEQYPQWREHLHQLGPIEVKHGAKLDVVNFYNDEVGNAKLPEKFKATRLAPVHRRKAFIGAALFLAVAASIVTWLFFHRSSSPIAALPVSDKSIAVLPFENLSKDEENAFFASGVQDEILANLAKVADLKVISRTSVILYKSGNPRNLREIGQQLGVAHVLEGSVQRAANRVRVMAQLIDARTDAHLWAETYDRDLADVFAIQSEIAQKIAEQLQTKLSPKEKAAIEERPTKDLAAYDLYLRAKEFLYDSRGLAPSRIKDACLEAVQLLDEALARDPAFLLAHCRLAYAHDFIYFSNIDHTETRLALAETSVEAAVRLQPDSGETHLAQAIHFYWGQLDYVQAREELAKAQRGLPNNAEIFQFLGFIDRRQGHWEEAIRNLKHAVDLDPRNIDMNGALGATYLMLRRYGEAIAMYNRALALETRNNYMRVDIASIRVDADADTAPLRAVLNTIVAGGPSSAAEVAEESFQLALRERDPVAAARALANIPSEGTRGLPHAWFEGLLAKLRQDAPGAHAAFTAARAEVEKIVRAQSGNVDPLNPLAFIDAELGHKEKAIQQGRTACDILPPAKDAVAGVALITYLAHIYALTGEKDLALKELEIVSKLPCGPSYGELRLDLEWDSLRGDPRFEKIIADLAPKDVK